MAPSFPPKHETLVNVELIAKTGGCETVTTVVCLQPIASVIITEYVPTDKLFAIEVV